MQNKQLYHLYAYHIYPNPFNIKIFLHPFYSILDETHQFGTGMVINILCYTLDSTAGVWPQHVKLTLPGHLFTNLGFPKCPCCLEVNNYSRFCHDYRLMIWLTDDGRLFILDTFYTLPIRHPRRPHPRIFRIL